MTKDHFHEDQFFDALRDIFVGAEIEGESGFINLMRIKSRYYQEGVFPQLKADIDDAVADSAFREELFDKLYTFFQRYFSESGSIYFRYTPLHQKIYEQVYTDDRDVVLFWKTHMLYYVKTDRIFNSLRVEVDDVTFYFDAENIEHKRANEKRDVVFTFREVAPDGALVFDTAYSVRGRITKIEQILRDLRKEDVHLADETLEKAFRVFEKQSEVDYFINKNARAFLEEQFDLWMYQYLFAEKNVWTAERLAQLQALKDIAFKVIGFISQFEDELVKIWNKPKFVRGSHYVLTLDHLIERGGDDLLADLFAHAGMAEQITEWVDLGMLKEEQAPEELLRRISAQDLTGAYLNPELGFLPLDTQYFPDLELRILGCFEDLDEALDGWLIHSENYQALNTIKNKFDQKVKSIYIDPPFNLDSSDQFSYRTNYKNANWATLLENRLRIAKDFLNCSGNIFVRCDYNGNWIVRCLMDQIFIENNYRNEVTTQVNESKVL
jgi:adenine-specific DNA-methyltransferase